MTTKKTAFLFVVNLIIPLFCAFRMSYIDLKQKYGAQIEESVQMTLALKLQRQHDFRVIRATLKSYLFYNSQ